jgi:hypothetical protein
MKTKKMTAKKRTIVKNIKQLICLSIGLFHLAESKDVAASQADILRYAITTIQNLISKERRKLKDDILYEKLCTKNFKESEIVNVLKEVDTFRQYTFTLDTLILYVIKLCSTIVTSGIKPINVYNEHTQLLH